MGLSDRLVDVKEADVPTQQMSSTKDVMMHTLCAWKERVTPLIWNILLVTLIWGRNFFCAVSIMGLSTFLLADVLAIADAFRPESALQHFAARGELETALAVYNFFGLTLFSISYTAITLAFRVDRNFRKQNRVMI